MISSICIFVLFGCVVFASYRIRVLRCELVKATKDAQEWKEVSIESHERLDEQRARHSKTLAEPKQKILNAL